MDHYDKKLTDQITLSHINERFDINNKIYLPLTLPGKIFLFLFKMFAFVKSCYGQVMVNLQTIIPDNNYLLPHALPGK